MRLARVAGVIAVLLLTIVPEVRRYRAERLLWRARSALDLLAADPGGAPDARQVLAWVGRSARECAGDLPGDPRPWMIASSARFFERDPAGALADLRRAFDAGERADVDFQAGRAFVLLRDMRRGQTALLRSAWISPVILADLPGPARASFENEVRSLEVLLKAGRLPSPPAAPEWR